MKSGQKVAGFAGLDKMNFDDQKVEFDLSTLNLQELAEVYSNITEFLEFLILIIVFSSSSGLNGLTKNPSAPALSTSCFSAVFIVAW